jgi:hypothetical protein
MAAESLRATASCITEDAPGKCVSERERAIVSASEEGGAQGKNEEEGDTYGQ